MVTYQQNERIVPRILGKQPAGDRNGADKEDEDKASE